MMKILTITVKSTMDCCDHFAPRSIMKQQPPFLAGVFFAGGNFVAIGQEIT